MDSQEIEFWNEEYDEHYDDELRAIEETLTKELAEQQYITQEQLERIIWWKLSAQPGRRDGNIERMRDVPDGFIRQVSKAAFLVDNPKVQLKTLTSIPGIGAATATVILAFYDPVDYAIGDRYMIDALFGEDRGLRITDYPSILEELRDLSPGGFDLRTVEKAYYRKYRDEQGVGRW